jgi:hypothetical protein
MAFEVTVEGVPVNDRICTDPITVSVAGAVTLPLALEAVIV